MVITEELRDFKKYLEKNFKSEKTINAYISDIIQFVTYFKPKHIFEIENEDVEDYKKYLLEVLQYSPTTVNRKLVSIHQYLTFCQVAVTIRQVKIQTQNFLEDIFETDDVQKLIEATESEGDLRAKALILTLQYTGMRISEALTITINDINKDTIIVVGKGNKRRNVFIPDKLKEVWKEYCKVRINKTDMLFTGQKGRISRQLADRIIKKYADKAGVEYEKAHCHNLRHYYCSELAKRGLGIDVISDLAGHTDINTSKIYTRRSKKELLEIINKI